MESLILDESHKLEDEKYEMVFKSIERFMGYDQPLIKTLQRFIYLILTNFLVIVCT